MKKLTTISLFIFWAAVTAILTSGLVYYQKNNLASCVPFGGGNGLGPNSTATGTLELNMQEIARHNNSNDCWIIINNKIYNVGSYLNSHPGGAYTITPYCGKDSTTAFVTRGGGGSHSSFAYSILNNYYIGDVGQTVGAQHVVNAVQQSNATVAPRGEREFEDD